MEESGTLQLSRIIGPVITACALVIQCVLPIGQLVIGAMYQYDCPRQPWIPVYLVVMGAVTLLLNVLQVLMYYMRSIIILCIFCILSIVSLFSFCWFITGNVWIYSIYEPSYNNTASNMDNYCNKTLYLFAFWSTNLLYIMIGLNICLHSFLKF